MWNSIRYSGPHTATFWERNSDLIIKAEEWSLKRGTSDTSKDTIFPQIVALSDEYWKLLAKEARPRGPKCYYVYSKYS